MGGADSLRASLVNAGGVSTDHWLAQGMRLIQPTMKPAMKVQAQVLGSHAALAAQQAIRSATRLVHCQFCQTQAVRLAHGQPRKALNRLS